MTQNENTQKYLVRLIIIIQHTIGQFERPICIGFTIITVASKQYELPTLRLR